VIRTGSSSEPRDTDVLHAALIDHAVRGVHLQARLRFVLVAFVLVTILVVPPEGSRIVSFPVTVLYALAAVAFAVWSRGDRETVATWGWTGLFLDVAVLAVVTVVTGLASPDTWTDEVLVLALFVVPVLAATQLRPGVCASVVVPTAIAYLVVGLLTTGDSPEPSSSVVMQTVALVVVGIGCVALSAIQRSRVATIGALLEDRSELLEELLQLEARERRELSERLHDGALQYVLAARQDMDDVQEGVEGSAERVQEALVESARLLRSTVADLHPAVLERAGLVAALQALVDAQSRPDEPVSLEVGAWPEGERHPLDALLYGVARELVMNARKHAGATSIVVRLDHLGSWLRLEVADDGTGIDEQALAAAVAAGHIGLHTQRVRAVAAGGTFSLLPGSPRGTVVRVEVPAGSGRPAG